MSKGHIKDYRIRIKPSLTLVNFICSLTNENLMPENLIKIFNCYTNENSVDKKTISIEKFPNPQYTHEENTLIKDLLSNKKDSNDIDSDILKALSKIINATDCSEELSSSGTDDDDIVTIDHTPKSKNQVKRNKEQQKQKKRAKLTITLNDLKWLHICLTEKRNVDSNCKIYLHELLEDSKLILPQNEIIERNPELEARCVKLRLEQDARRYRAMTKNVDTTKKHVPEDTIAYQSK